MAENGEEPAANAVLTHIQSQLNINNGTAIRLDNLWFEQHDIDIPANEWAKGTPDYVLSLNDQGVQKHFHTEIKIKDQEFRKTRTGGTTRGGSLIPNYGCASFYLDVEPVYRNMIDFAQKSGLAKSRFIIDFYSRENDEHHIITLEETERIILRGWNGIEISTYGEGYGQIAYLIPKNATRKLNELSEADILGMSTNIVVLP